MRDSVSEASVASGRQAGGRTPPCRAVDSHRGALRTCAGSTRKKGGGGERTVNERLRERRKRGGRGVSGGALETSSRGSCRSRPSARPRPGKGAAPPGADPAENTEGFPLLMLDSVVRHRDGARDAAAPPSNDRGGRRSRLGRSRPRTRGGVGASNPSYTHSCVRDTRFSRKIKPCRTATQKGTGYIASHGRFVSAIQ